jgi:hypothetical protein
VRGGATNKGNKNNMPMKINLRKPCSQCPFRRNSLRGWLGPWDVEQLLHHLGRGEFPCHQTIKRDDQPVEELEGCAGAAIFLNNKLEVSRHPRVQEHQDAVADVSQEVKDGVFDWGDEFREHHATDHHFDASDTAQSIASRMLQPAGRERKRTGKRPGRWREAAPARSQKVSR